MCSACEEEPTRSTEPGVATEMVAGNFAAGGRWSAGVATVLWGSGTSPYARAREGPLASGTSKVVVNLFYVAIEVPGFTRRDLTP